MSIRELDKKSDSCQSKMDSGGQKGVPMLALVAHQNHTSIDPNQVEFLKSFYGNARLDPNKVHPSLLQMLQELEKEDPCKNYFLDKRNHQIQMSHLNLHA